jgi:hypothetical protein
MVHGDFISPLHSDVFRMLCGERIGRGKGREVYDCAYDPSLVVKIESGSGSFQNIIEWNTWGEAEYIPHAAAWLAPCIKISPCGIVLVQKKTMAAKNYPEKLPVWLTDTKRSNYGMIGRTFVCHDYGVNLMCNSGLSKRLHKTKWWDAL